jgi:accessory gene regulator B
MKPMVDTLLDNMKKYNPEMTEAQLRTRRFGLESLITELSKTLVFIIIFSIIGVALPYVVSLLVYGAIRAFSGGYHANSYWSCFFISLVGFAFTIGAGFYSGIGNIACIAALAASTAVDLVFAPVPHPNKPNKDPLKRKRFKIISFIIILVFGGIAFLLPYQYKITVIASIVLVAVMQLFGHWLNGKSKDKNIIMRGAK